MRHASTYRAFRRNVWREDGRYTWPGLPENNEVTQPSRGKRFERHAKRRLSIADSARKAVDTIERKVKQIIKKGRRK